jgi:hypothetical protein
MTALARQQQQQQHKSLIMPWRRGHRNCIKIRVQIPPGVDVMITIFCDFWRKIWRFSQKPML